jgi:hypothetical protein
MQHFGMDELNICFPFLTALSSGNMSHKEKSDGNPMFYDTYQIQTTDSTTIEGKI